MFRYKTSIPVDYDRQGYIFFKSRLYTELSEREQQKVLNLCIKHGGEYYQALFDFVTTDVGAVAICMRYSLSRSTLERAVRKYYIGYAKSMTPRDTAWRNT